MLIEPFTLLFDENIVHKADISFGLSAADCNKSS
jgi:hypothetical protein